MRTKYILTLIGLGLLSIGNIFSQEITEVVVVPDYDKNFKLFLGLLALMGILLLAISMVAASIRTLAQSDYYQEKMLTKKEADKKSSGKQTMLSLLLLGGMLLFGNKGWALSFKPEEGGEGRPWLQVENIDLILILCLNIALLILYFYLKSVFTQLIQSVTSDDELKKQEQSKKEILKINKFLTDAVPVEEEESIIMDHEFDGIRELDNNLPPWWVVLFWATIVFAVVYMFHYHVFKTGDLQIAEYDKSMEKAEIETQKYLSKMEMNVDENTATVMTDAKDLGAGKVIYESNCTVCHREKGEGDIGPNLTDDYWLYSNDIKDIFKVIKNGTSKGMPEHASKLNPVQIQQVSSYVLSLPYAAGKEPEGKEMAR